MMRTIYGVEGFFQPIATDFYIVSFREFPLDFSLGSNLFVCFLQRLIVIGFGLILQAGDPIYGCDRY